MIINNDKINANTTGDPTNIFAYNHAIIIPYSPIYFITVFVNVSERNSQLSQAVLHQVDHRQRLADNVGRRCPAGCRRFVGDAQYLRTGRRPIKRLIDKPTS